jgi:hypothetical protein
LLAAVVLIGMLGTVRVAAETASHLDWQQRFDTTGNAFGYAFDVKDDMVTVVGPAGADAFPCVDVILDRRTHAPAVVRVHEADTGRLLRSTSCCRRAG